MTEFGYAGKILKVDLSDGGIEKISSSAYTDRFLGGRGLAAKIYWDMVPPETNAFDPENCLICATGPVAGFPGFAGYRWQLCGKAPAGDPVRARAEAERARQMSDGMGYHWGQVDAAEVLAVLE